ncbi:hypothetical protein NPIL_606451 [Nephila pilipes]|uniref:Uncharacterized protein n=1 Tax=Nephila pilipes TaxID=299642 RepID=A0A8X6JMM0_NEPPI|nr:hypothetical protein NPIL_439641 [Nephila pilipes]GFT49990.1 hypothetical protein NPIL_606451 [Nephila pilipes]
MEPFSNFSPQGSHLSICYYHQDLHRQRLQAGSRHALPCHRRDPPTRFSTKKKFGEQAGYELDAGVPSIFRNKRTEFTRKTFNLYISYYI